MNKKLLSLALALLMLVSILPMAAFADIETADSVGAANGIKEPAFADIAAQQALEADIAAFEAYKLAQAEACNALILDSDSQDLKNLIATTATVIAMTPYNEDLTLEENKANIDELINDLENILPVLRAYETAVAEIIEAAGEVPSDAVQEIMDQAFYELANADSVEAVNAVKEQALNAIAEQQAKEVSEALEALKGTTIFIINTMKGDAVSDEAKALADEAIAAVERAKSVEELDAAFSGLDDAMAAKDAEFVQAKADALAAIDAAVDGDTSANVAAVAAEAKAAIEAASGIEAVAAAKQTGEDNIAAVKAANAEALLREAKDSAIAELRAYAEEKGIKDTSVVEKAVAEIENAGSIDAINIALANGKTAVNNQYDSENAPQEPTNCPFINFVIKLFKSLINIGHK